MRPSDRVPGSVESFYMVQCEKRRLVRAHRAGQRAERRAARREWWRRMRWLLWGRLS